MKCTHGCHAFIDTLKRLYWQLHWDQLAFIITSDVVERCLINFINHLLFMTHFVSRGLMHNEVKSRERTNYMNADVSD